jgi:hypothetical protein
MDEKRFDVDGTYNARYEVVKNVLTKQHIKGTTERITERENYHCVLPQLRRNRIPKVYQVSTI